MQATNNVTYKIRRHKIAIIQHLLKPTTSPKFNAQLTFDAIHNHQHASSALKQPAPVDTVLTIWIPPADHSHPAAL